MLMTAYEHPAATVNRPVAAFSGGALVGGVMLGLVATVILYPLLAAILLLSAIKVWRHE